MIVCERGWRSEHKTNVLDPLDALRVFAILLVFGLHASKSSGFPITVENFILFLPGWAGVWIFFSVSGYLAGRGFKDGRYGNMLYYLKKRFVRIGLPYIAFIFIIVCLLLPTLIVKDPLTVVRLFTFTYNGDPGLPSLTLMWFVSSIMQMYVIAAFLSFLIKRMKRTIYACGMLFAAILTCGLALRLVLLESGLAWGTYVYTLSLSNLDVFFCGFLLNWIVREKQNVKEGVRRSVQVFSIVLLLTLTVFFAYCYTASFDQSVPGGEELLIIYRYLGPTLVIVTVCIFVYASDRSVKEHNIRLSATAIRRNPLRIVECFSAISLGFYFWHVTILERVIPAVLPRSPELIHCMMVWLTAGTLSVVMSAIYYYSVEKMSARMLKWSVRNSSRD